MCDDALVRPTSREDDSISSGTASGVHLLVTQDGELIVRSVVWEGEAFVVVVLVRVVIVAHGGPVLIVAVTLLHGGVDVVLGVACAAAGFCALALGGVSCRDTIWGTGIRTRTRGLVRTGTAKASAMSAYVRQYMKRGAER